MTALTWTGTPQPIGSWSPLKNTLRTVLLPLRGGETPDRGQHHGCAPWWASGAARAAPDRGPHYGYPSWCASGAARAAPARRSHRTRERRRGVEGGYPLLADAVDAATSTVLPSPVAGAGAPQRAVAEMTAAGGATRPPPAPPPTPRRCGRRYRFSGHRHALPPARRQPAATPCRRRASRRRLVFLSPPHPNPQSSTLCPNPI